MQGLQPGGQLTITTDVENYPGFAEVIQGPWLMEQMQKQAEHVGTKLVHDIIVSVDLSQRPFVCIGDSGDIYIADALAICTGAQARWLGLPSEEKFRGFGVSACATCDGFFFRGKEVVVVGGGNTAVEEALYLTNHATQRHADPSPRPAARREDPAGAAVRQSEDRRDLGQRGRGILGDGDAARTSPACGSQRQDRRAQRASPATASSSPSATRRSPSCSRASSTLDDDGYIVTKPDSTATDDPGRVRRRRCARTRSSARR